MRGQKDAAAMTERRHVKRTSAGQSAAILLRESGVLHRCLVKNLTESGASILLASDFDLRLPKNFEVTFDRGLTVRSCVVVWRDGHEVGVQWKMQTHVQS
jgi:hypothetical protein